MLYTASFYAPGDWRGEAFRVSRAHPRGKKTQWGTLPFLYPTRPLLTAYRAGEVDFAGLAMEYREELEQGWQRSPEFQNWMEEIPRMGDFTLLCFEKAGEPCHRRILARWLTERVPALRVGEIR